MNCSRYFLCILAISVSAGSHLAICQDAATATAKPKIKFAIPDTDDSLIGEGPMRRADWFRNLWNERRSDFEKQVDQDQKSVVFFGDSITQGWDNRLTASFPDMKVANRGISGDTTRGMLNRFQDDVLDLHPTGLVMLMGTNDLEEGAEPEVIARNISKIVDMAKDHDGAMPVVLCLVMPSSESKNRPSAKIKQVNQLCLDLAKLHPQVMVLDTWSLFAGPDGDAKKEEFPDLLHPNEAGYTKWAAALQPAFATLGFTETTADKFVVEDGFELLFNGTDLTGWQYRPTSPAMIKMIEKWKKDDLKTTGISVVNGNIQFDGVTSSPDGRYVAKQGRLIVMAPIEGSRIQQMWTTRELAGDFELRLEFRALPNADSGVFIREPQLQCRDYLTAGPYKELTKYLPQQWNEMVVVVKDNVAHCTCNGEVLEASLKLPETGPIGLEGDRGQMEYRRIRVKMLASTEADKSIVSGIDLGLISEQVKPGEDFYKYSNDKWLGSTQIPADKADYGIFTMLDDQTQQQVRELIETVAKDTNATPGTPAQKVGDLYRTYTDLDSRNSLGLKPIQKLIDDVKKADSIESMGKVMGQLHRFGVATPLGLYVSVDARNSDQYIACVDQSGLSLPDRDYYLVDEPQYLKLRTELASYAKDLLAAAGFSDAELMGKAIVEIETAIAKQQWTNTENRDPVATYNLRTSDELKSMVAPFPWTTFRDAYGLAPAQSIVVGQPSYFESLGKLVDSFSLDQWKAYQAYHLIDAYADSLTESLEKRHFEFHGTAISGIDEQRPLWKRAVSTTGSVLGELVGQLYVEKHFSPLAKQRMNELVGNLKRAFAARIESLEWMGEGTKKQAQEKLSQFTTKIGYPDVWKSYDTLTIGKESLAANLLAASEFESKRDLAKLGAPIDRNEWHMTPQTINAYYNPTMNEIVFPAAILQPPFFNLNSDDAVNYGGIGAVIGHELSHGFDDKGSKFDGKGNLRNWWTEDDRAEFDKRSSGLVSQYNEYHPVADMPINGELTLGENIGDLGGLSVSHAAYRLSLGGNEAPIIDGLSGDQRFFLGWGQIWRRLYRDAELRKRLIVDPHSPSQYRVNGIVRNMDAFYEAFKISPNDPMYIAPKDRVRIW